MWVLTCLALWAMWLAALDFLEQWRMRRRPVKGRDGKWRMP